MIRLKTIRRYKCSIAIIGVLSFVTVYGCDLFCDLGLISFSFAQHPISESDHHGDHHVDGHHHDQSILEHESSPRQHEESSESGCCDDLTSRFYLSLTNQVANTVAAVPVQMFKVILTLTKGDQIVISDYLNLIASKFDHPPNGPPATTGRFVRVLIDSFLI